MNLSLRSGLVGLVAALGVLGASARAEGCGGFFCSAVQPVNQAAERIIFANNGDGTQTAVIEIMYEGPSENFSWLLPISSVPMGDQIKVASALAFQRLQAATNPQYSLTTTVEGTCKAPPGSGASGGSGGGIAVAPSGGGSGGTSSNDGGVTVEASGIVGAFEWTVISLDPALSDPAQAAVDWLTEQKYDVPQGASSLLGSYLADGLYLLALRLTKGSDVGSIRPIVLTYEASRPMIPIKLTAVAANDDMGVMTWVLGDSRAVPQNYDALVLNEARINWFNPALNYNDVVTAAANDAGRGQGFVTELSGPTSTLANVVWPQYEESRWQSFSTGVYSSFEELFQASYDNYGSYDGFWDAIRAAVTLPDTLSFDSFKLCPSCYASQIAFDPAKLMAELENEVIEPIRGVQTLIDEHAQITRFYTTLSANEMNVDPVFTFNPDLAETSNVHTANRVIECNSSIYQSEAPWRIEFPQGGVLRGTAADVGTWPAAVANQPPNRVIRQEAEAGDGKVLDDQTAEIGMMLDAYNATVPAPAPGTGGTGTSGTTGSGGTKTGTGGTSGAGGTTASGGKSNAAPADSDSGCAVTPHADSAAPLTSLLGLLALAFRRRRRA